jgi:hypothetical protein
MAQTGAMHDERRAFPRFDVSLDLSCASAASETLRMHDLSEGGFLASGEMGAAVWERIEASIRLGPGEAGVRLYGTIMHAHPDGGRLVIGVRIDRFGSPEEKRAYLDYAGSLSQAS